MRPDSVVIVSPKRQLPAGVGQGIEYLLVQQFVAQAAVERLDEGVLLRLARVDVMPGHPVLVGPLQDGAAGELGGEGAGTGNAGSGSGGAASASGGANSGSGPFTDVAIGITADYLAGRDPFVVYSQCVERLTGQGPIRPPELR